MSPTHIDRSLMDAISSGFHPRLSTYTSAKLHHLMSTLTDSLARRFKIPVEKSLSAFIIPDSQQVLGPDEIFIAFSGAGPVDTASGCAMSYLEGPCLAFRSPCKLPTDVRKFMAVYRPELAHLKDCVVMSANSQLCHRSPASYLGGGDYDGDTVQLFWDPRLVNAFINADDAFAQVPEDFESQNFNKSVVKGDQFLRGLKKAEAETRVTNYQSFLLGALLDDKSTGHCESSHSAAMTWLIDFSDSDLHGNAVYALGFDHPETIRLARM